MTTTSTLTPDEVRSYTEHGTLFPLRAMSTEAAAGYRAKLEELEREHPETASTILRSKSHLALAWVAEIARLDPIVDAVSSIIGPDVYCWGSSFFIKNPHHPGFVAWHQDAPFSAIPPGAELLTAWVALAPSTVANGCLKVVPGTHTKQAEHVFTDNESNMLSQGQKIAVDVDEADAAIIELAPGEFSLHHQFIFHGSGPSQSDERRIGVAFRYMRPFQSETGDKVPATHIRGEDRYGCFEEEPRPRYDLEPSAVAYLDEQLRARHGDRYRTSK